MEENKNDEIRPNDEYRKELHESMERLNKQLDSSKKASGEFESESEYEAIRKWIMRHSKRKSEEIMKEDSNLEIHVTPGTAPPEEIALYLSKLSRLYKLMGGSGLEFRPSGVEINEREGVVS